MTLSLENTVAFMMSLLFIVAFFSCKTRVFFFFVCRTFLTCCCRVKKARKTAITLVLTEEKRHYAGPIVSPTSSSEFLTQHFKVSLRTLSRRENTK